MANNNITKKVRINFIINKQSARATWLPILGYGGNLYNNYESITNY